MKYFAKSQEMGDLKIGRGSTNYSLILRVLLIKLMDSTVQMTLE
jgi:hypothetical protein